MPATHDSGKILGTRLGTLGVEHTFPTFYTDVSGTSLKFLTVEATILRPAMYAVRAIIATANNSGTSATLSVGITSGGTERINAVDLKAAADTNYADSTVWHYTEANVDLYLTPTYVGTAATAGKAFVKVEVIEVNIKQATNQGD